MAFKRIFELTVGEDGTGLLISDLNMEFDINRSITFEENTAEFIIYNAKEDTRKKVLKKGNNLIFKTGYEDETIGTIFIGNITESVSRQEGPDWITTIQVSSIRSATAPLQNTYLSLSYAPDTLLSIVLKEIAIAMGLTLFGSQNAEINLDNGWTYSGSARGALRYCEKILKANSVGVYRDNNEIVIYRIDDRDSRFASVYLDYTSGLLNVEDITDYDNQKPEDPKRLGIDSLIIPKLQPRSLITLKSNSFEGVFQIEKINYSGDNYTADENICRMEVVE